MYQGKLTDSILQSEKYRADEIDRETYDRWRYNYPAYDENLSYVKVPSQELSDALVKAFMGKLKDM